jgi:hypothetical protein
MLETTSIERDKQGVTVVSKNMAMSLADSPPDRLPDRPPLDFPVNEMTSPERLIYPHQQLPTTQNLITCLYGCRWCRVC